VSWVKPKAPTLGASQRLEMAAVEGQYLENSVALGKNDYRGIGEAYCELPIASDDHSCCGHITCRERFELVGASSNFVKQRALRLRAHPGGEQVVEFSEDEGRQE